MLTVNFSLMAKETAGVGEASDVLTSRFIADVRSVVFVHMLTVTVMLAYISTVTDGGNKGNELILTSTRTSSKIQVVAEHTRDYCSTAYPLRFGVPPETFCCSDGMSNFLPNSETLPKACLDLLQHPEVQTGTKSLSDRKRRCEDWDNLACRSCAALGQNRSYQGSQ